MDDVSVAQEANSYSKIGGLFFLLILLLLAVLAVKGALEEFYLLQSVTSDTLLLRVNSITIPAVLSAPIYLIVAYGVVRRIAGSFPQSHIDFSIKAVGILFVVFLISWFVASRWQSSWLESKNFSDCRWYKGSTFFAPKVWLSNSDYCIKSGYKVRFELYDWLRGMEAGGYKPTADEVEARINELLLAGGYD